MNSGFVQRHVRIRLKIFLLNDGHTKVMRCSIIRGSFPTTCLLSVKKKTQNINGDSTSRFHAYMNIRSVTSS